MSGTNRGLETIIGLSSKVFRSFKAVGF